MSYLIEPGHGFKCHAVLWTKPLKRLHSAAREITGLEAAVLMRVKDWFSFSVMSSEAETSRAEV